MSLVNKGMAPAVLLPTPEPGPQRIGGTVNIAKSSASAAHDPYPSEGAGEHRDCFACYEGTVYIGHIVPLPDGEQEEVYTAYLCRLCGCTGRIDG